MDLMVRLMAVVGGAALGAMAIGFIVRLFGRFLGTKSVPTRPLMVLRGLAGAVSGWVAWLVVFGTGGGGIGGPGGLDRGGGDNAASMTSPSSGSSAHDSASMLTPERAPSLSVAMLGGPRVANERFYLVLGEKEARSLMELGDYIQQRQKEGIRAVDILIYENSVAEAHTAVTNLREWARRNGLEVKVAFSSGEAP